MKVDFNRGNVAHITCDCGNRIIINHGDIVTCLKCNKDWHIISEVVEYLED